MKHFPRRHNRGRIEAGTPRFHAHARLAFHGVTTVAELKPYLSDCLAWHQPAFHGVTTVAELKPLFARRGYRVQVPFHGVTTVAELKRVTSHFLDTRIDLSTASQPWPN